MSRRWACLLVGGLLVALALVGFDARPVDAQEDEAQEEQVEQEGQAPWAGYDPGPSPEDYDGELYHGRGESTSPWEEDDGCEHRYYDWGTPYWDCHSRGYREAESGDCSAVDFHLLTAEGRFVSVEGDWRGAGGRAFVICEDPNGPYTSDDLRQIDLADGEDGEDGDDDLPVCEPGRSPSDGPCRDADGDSDGDGERDVDDDGTTPLYGHHLEDGKRYRVCTHRPSTMYGTDWMHCPTYGFGIIPCVETQGAGFAIDLPVMGDTQVGDENDGFWEALADGFADQFEARIVPETRDPAAAADADLRRAMEQAQRTYGDDLAWWYDEVGAESESEGGKGCSLAENLPTYRTCEEINEDRDHAQAVLAGYSDEDDVPSDVMTGTLAQRSQEQAYYEELIRDLESQGSIIPETCFGAFPTDAYRIFYDTGSSFDASNWPGQLMGTSGELAFGGLKLGVSGSLWATREALTLDVTEYRDVVADLANRWDLELVGIGGGRGLLRRIGWFALFGTVAIMVLLRRAGRGVGEIAGSMVAATLVAVLWAGAYSSGGYFDSAVGLADSLSRGMLLAGSGCDPNDVLDQDEVERLVAGRYQCGDDAGDVANQGGLGGVIHREFVEVPFRHINWGTDDLSPACEAAEERLLRLNGVNNDYATRFMDRQGCVDEANHSGQMTIGRLTSTLLVTLLGLFVSVLLGSFAFTLLASKFIVALLFLFLPFLGAFAIFPGRGRRPALWGLETLIKAELLALLTGGVLAGGMHLFQGFSEALDGQPMIRRHTIFGLGLFTLWSLYKQADKAGQSVAAAAGRRAGQVLSPSGDWSSLGTGGGAGGTGGISFTGPARVFSGAGIDRATSLITAAGVTTTAAMVPARALGRLGGSPVRGLGRSTVARNTERRVANRSIKNLVRKDVLAGNLAIDTPVRTGGLRRAVRRARHDHPGGVVPKPDAASSTASRSLHSARSSSAMTARRAARRDMLRDRPDVPSRPEPPRSGGAPLAARDRTPSGSGDRVPGGEAKGTRDGERRFWPAFGRGDSERQGFWSGVRGRGKEPLQHRAPTNADLSVGTWTADAPRSHTSSPTTPASGGAAASGTGGARGATGGGAAPTPRPEPVSPASARHRAAQAQAARDLDHELFWDGIGNAHDIYRNRTRGLKPKSKEAQRARDDYRRAVDYETSIFSRNTEGTGRRVPRVRDPWDDTPGGS